MKDIFTSIFAFILYISSIGAYGLGIFHSFKKHGIKDGLIGAVLFPYAMYRGVEFWWHDDYSNVNWDKRLTNDMQSCVYFVSSVNDNTVDKYQLNENLEKFSEKINDYPADKRQYLLNGTKKYILYSNSLYSDFLTSFNDYKKNGNFNWSISVKTKKLEIELANFKLKDDIDLTKKGIEEICKRMTNKLPSDTSSIDFYKIKDIETAMNLYIEFQQKELRKIFKSLFNEEL
jgi:hypothetical protein